MRPLPPLGVRPRPDGRARAGELPLLDRLAARAAVGARARRTRPAWTSTGAWPRGCSSAGSSRSRRSTTGTCRRRCRTPAAGASATRPSASPSTPRSSPRGSATRVAVDHAQRAVGRRLPRPRLRHQGAGHPPLAHRAARLAPPAAVPRPGAAGPARAAGRPRAGRDRAQPVPDPSRRPRRRPTATPPGGWTATSTAGSWIRSSAAATRPTWSRSTRACTGRRNRCATTTSR